MAEGYGTAAGAAWAGEQEEADEELMEHETASQTVQAIEGCSVAHLHLCQVGREGHVLGVPAGLSKQQVELKVPVALREDHW